MCPAYRSRMRQKAWLEASARWCARASTLQGWQGRVEGVGLGGGRGRACVGARMSGTACQDGLADHLASMTVAG